MLQEGEVDEWLRWGPVDASSGYFVIGKGISTPPLSLKSTLQLHSTLSTILFDDARPLTTILPYDPEQWLAESKSSALR